ncbi:MAG: hypothetical protein J6P32_00035, partial [Stomatobaculum sp.]|nr:hypothetical protein [Stomatobaculum sp.]
IPVLYKDFITTRYQVATARAAGADAVLLIAAVLDDAALADLLGFARSFGMEALVETHDAKEIARAVSCGAKVVGVNCRNLRNFHRLPALFLSDTELLLRFFAVIDQILLICGKSSAGPVGLQLCCLLYIFTGPEEQHDPVTHGDALRRLPCLQVLFRQLIHPLFVDLRRGITLQRDDFLLRGCPLRAQDLILKQILPGIVVDQIFKLRAEGIRLLHISGPNREFRQPEHDMPRVRCALHRQKKDLLRLLQFPVLLINVGDQGKKVHVRDPSPVDAVGDLHCRLVIMKIILFPHLVDFQIELVFIHCHWSCLFRFCCHSSK